jgi:DNA-directed RNA polymerase subunit RPC12/RpoP
VLRDVDTVRYGCPMTAAAKTTARIDHTATGKGVACEHCGYAIQVSKRHVVTHAANKRRACPTH